MGLFNNYMKPGPGISKDAPQKKWIFRYFEIFFRKFWKLIKATMLTFALSLPFMLILFLIAPITDGFITALIGDIDSNTLVSLQVTLRTFFAVTVYNLIGSGPASCGYAYITRCFTREEHAWLISDFFDKFKENFLQSIILSILDIVFIIALTISIRYYYFEYTATNSAMFLVLFSILISLSVLLIFMHFCIYQMMITFKNSLIQTLYNSFIVAIVQLPMNILLFAIALAVNFILFLYLPNVLAVILSLLITTALVRFPIEYCTARTIEKKILTNLPKKDEEV